MGGLLADEMGLGKTLQVIAALSDSGGKTLSPALIIAPGSLLENWRREIAKFAPHLRVLKHHGALRTGRPVELQGYDVVITSYDNAVGDNSLLNMILWKVVILDEAQFIRNPSAQRTKAVIADNKLALNAGWDLELLAVEIGDLQGFDFDLMLTGFSDDELGKLLAEKTEGNTDPDDIPEAPIDPIAKPGDVWLLGKHRLVCGDSTDADTVAKALNGVSPHLMVTDPPYGVEYDPAWREKAGVAASGTAKGKVLTRAELVEVAKLNEIASLLWFPESSSQEERDARIVKALDLFESIKPAEGLETMLAMQMVGTHHAAMECLRRAMIPEQTFEGRNANLDQAQRLMALYTQQLAALAKHRGKGQQKITVERVQVAPGGQAVLGNVEMAPAAPPAEAPAAPPALAPPREDTVPLPPMPTRDKVRR
ncbi:SNF2 family N-terminal domain-containing protein [Porphyrobacter sp. LM 6]|nr:SNF2 family N-terminal domain-containing protein [Porphyrobacter sp. LM 6]